MTYQTDNRADSRIRVWSRLIKGSGWVFYGKVFGMVLGVMVNAVLARLLAPVDLGTYFLVSSVVLTAALICQGGFQKVVVRSIPRSINSGKPGEVRSIVWQSLIVTIGISGVIALLFYFFAGVRIAGHIFDSPGFTTVIDLAALWLALWAILALVAEIFRGFQAFGLATIFTGLCSSSVILGVLLSAYFFEYSLTLRQVVLLSLFSVAASLSIAITILGMKVKKLPNLQKIALRNLTALAIPFWMTAIFFMIIRQASVWIIGAAESADQVALYVAAFKISDLITTPLLIANAVLPPIISELHTKGEKKELESIVRSVASITGVSALLGIIVLLVAARPLLELIYGEFYTLASPILIILAIGGLASVLTGSCANTLMMTGHQYIAMWIVGLSGVATVILGIIVVRPYGAIGVATVSAIMTVVCNLVLLFAAKRVVGVWTHLYIGNPIRIYHDIRNTVAGRLL